MPKKLGPTGNKETYPEDCVQKLRGQNYLEGTGATEEPQEAERGWEGIP